MKIKQLKPGMEYKTPTGFITLISVGPHPLYNLRLVTWIDQGGEVILDALSEDQEVGDPIGGGQTAQHTTPYKPRVQQALIRWRSAYRNRQNGR